MPSTATSQPTKLTSREAHTLRFEGRLDAECTGRAWRAADRLFADSPLLPLVVDVTDVEYVDGAGAAFLMHLQAHQETAGQSFELIGMSPEQARLLELYETSAKKEAARTPLSLIHI